MWRLTLTLLSARPSHLSVGFSHHNTETLMWRQPLGNSHLIFRFFLAQVPAEANKQFIGRKIGSFYHRITLPRPINLHLDCQYSIDRPIIASMELRKKSSGSISIFHLSFSLQQQQHPRAHVYEIWTNGLDYFLSPSFPFLVIPSRHHYIPATNMANSSSSSASSFDGKD